MKRLAYWMGFYLAFGLGYNRGAWDTVFELLRGWSRLS